MRAATPATAGADVLRTTVSEGMRTLRQDGIDKVLQGITDMTSVRGSTVA
jgi:type II secretory ATPase GspE/PulE/Tfp pilus assembly ATPase PilB-like protein